MLKFYKWSVEFLEREDGPTAVEYAVMLALIVAVCISGIMAVGNNAAKTFTIAAKAISATGS